jgi:mannose-6-phosphate isomerase-like protein (cupin superfamily)/glycosyltransferase involved in cell wall biosynthesis
MRLALLSSRAWSIPPRQYGPREKLLSLLCEGLVAQGIDVTLFATADSTTQGTLAAICSVLSTDTPDGDSKAWDALCVARLSTQAKDFDLIHIHGDFLPLAYSRLLHTPMVTTLYEAPPPPLLSLFSQDGMRHYHVAPSAASRSSGLEYVATVYPGIHLAELPFRDTPGTYLVFCGRLHPEAEVITALRIAQQCDMPLKLIGPVADQAYFATQIAPHLAPGRIEYLATLAPGACYDLLAGAYALLQLSQKPKPFSLSAVEAMACGTPVVAFATGAMPEIVLDGETGYLVTDVAEAPTKLRQVAGLERQRCRQWVATRFSQERMVAEYVDVYTRLLEREKPHAHHASPPWGRWEVLLDEPTYKVKRITVLPDKRLSYQKHFKREEHWTIVQGQALVTLDGQELTLSAGETVNIPHQTAHRIANPGPENLVFIEVQRGTYFGEDDIIRLQDDYGRAGT